MSGSGNNPVERHDAFAAEVKRVLAEADLPTELLEIERTESVAFGNPALFATFDALRALGVHFAADDFGTGYSCLQHLKCCPITRLQIDQSLVARLPDDARDQTIVRAVIQLTHGLDMTVVAEGMETPGSLRGCGRPTVTWRRTSCSPSRCRRRPSSASSTNGGTPP